MMTRRSSAARPPASIYVAGLLSMGYTDFYIFVIPLYALSLGMNAGQIGALVGARSVLAVFLSIHIGVLMDRFGTRRVTLLFVWTAICLAPVFPLLPWFWPLLLLQMITGGALSFAWSGSQTLIAQLADGDAGYIGRFSFFARIGTTFAPIVAGIAWDFGGAWPTYMIGVVWGVALTIALMRAPEAEISGDDNTAPTARFRLRDVMPRPMDYARCFALMTIPVIATTMAIMCIRNATYSAQTSLFVVYLNDIGLAGTSIGILFAAVEISGSFGSLFAGRAMRVAEPQRTMLNGTVLSILLICATPFLGGIYALLLMAQAVRGWLQGVVQPMMFSVQGRAVGRNQQGAVVGLRQTANRASAIIIPPIMGVIADWCGAAATFVILGGALLVCCVPIARIARRTAARPAPVLAE